MNFFSTTTLTTQAQKRFALTATKRPLLREVLASDSPDAQAFATAQEKTSVMITCNRNDYLELGAQQPHHDGARFYGSALPCWCC